MLRWILAASLLGLALFGGVARAQNTPQSAPILFSADELQTDEDLGLVVAKGHVQISQDLQTLLADTVTYNRRSDTITASGNVSLQQPTGEILFADFMELSDHFQEGFMKDIRILLSDRSRLAGNTARRTGGERIELRRGVYSPCDLISSSTTTQSSNSAGFQSSTRPICRMRIPPSSVKAASSRRPSAIRARSAPT
jgi:LPS-assembly protein